MTAAGRIAQHRALWQMADDVPLGPPPFDGPPEKSLTYYAATKAIADLDHTPGRSGLKRGASGMSH